MSRHNIEVAMQRLWFSQARLNGGWAKDVRLTLSGGLIDSVETGVAPGAGDERRGIAIPGLWSHGLGGRDKGPIPTIQQRQRNRALAGSGQPWDTRTGPEDLAVLVRCDGPLTICDRSAERRGGKPTVLII